MKKNFTPLTSLFMLIAGFGATHAASPGPEFRQVVFKGDVELVSQVSYSGESWTDLDNVWLDLSSIIGTERESVSFNFSIDIAPEYVDIANIPEVVSEGSDVEFKVSGSAENGFYVNFTLTPESASELSVIEVTLTSAQPLDFTFLVLGYDDPAIVKLYHQAAAGPEEMNLVGAATDLTIYSNYPNVFIDISRESDSFSAYEITGVTVNGEDFAGYQTPFPIENGDIIAVSLNTKRNPSSALIYAVGCEYDVLEFEYEDGRSAKPTVKYANGYYIVSNIDDNALLQATVKAGSTYDLTGLTAVGDYTVPSFGDNRFTLVTPDYPTGTVFYVELKESETTGVRDVTVTERKAQEIYTLQGTKVNPSGKLNPGIYIINGKAVIVGHE